MFVSESWMFFLSILVCIFCCLVPTGNPSVRLDNVVSLTMHQILSEHNESRRQKRYLLFTKDTQWGVFATVSIPLHPETTVSVAWFFEANYYNVDNATYFQPLLGDIGSISRKQRDADKKELLTRKRIYTFIETMLEREGYPGQPCVLRAICENATSHFLHNGILGDFIHLLLTPSASEAEDDIEDCYYEAEYLGLENQCQYYNLHCPNNPLELISIELEDFI